MEEGELNEEGEGEEGEGEEGEGEEGEEGEVEDGEVEDEPPTPDQLNLAKLFAGPNEYKDVSSRQHLDR